MIKNIFNAFIIRAPIAIAVFYVSVKQNKLFDSASILSIGAILSSSVLFSILFLQPLGNIYNRDIGLKKQNQISSFTDYKFLVLFLISIILLLSILFQNNIELLLSLNLATAQALYQWCMSYLTVNDKKNQLFFLSFILPLELLFLVNYFDFLNESIYTWLKLLIVSYYIPSISLFILNLKFKFLIKEKIILFFEFIKIFSSSATFFTVLSFLFWMLEFYPRNSNYFDHEFSSKFNVYVTFSIGLVGSIDLILGQTFLKSFLKLASNSKNELKLYFYKIFKFYIIIYIIMFFLLGLFNKIYWPYVFDNLRFNDILFFLFILFLQILRILCFQTFNIFYYLNDIKSIKNNIILFLILVAILYIFHIFLNNSGYLYLSFYGFISIIIILINYKSLSKVS